MTEDAKTLVCKEILEIMEEYHRQSESKNGVDTPGGLEHMGDVWKLFLKWEESLKSNETESCRHEETVVADDGHEVWRECKKCGLDFDL